MSVITQMTLYGVYDLKYLRGGHQVGARSKTSAPAPSAVKTYKEASAFFYLKNSFLGQSAAIQTSHYKQQLASAFTVSQKLAEQSEQFIVEKWPKMKVSDSSLVRGQADDNARQAEYSLEVVELAKRHTFISNPLWLNTEELADKGVHAVTLEKDGHKEKAIFHLGEHDNARVILKKAADAINSFSSLGRARLLEEGGAVRLLISANVDGAAGRFSIYDDTGGLLAKAGISLQEQGSDGLVVVDGESRALTSNFLKLDDNRLMLEFLRTGSENVKILPDGEAAATAVDALFNAYNDFRQFFNQADNKTGRTRDMLNVFDEHSHRQVAAMTGLWQSEDGSIGVKQGTDCLPFINNIATDRWGLASTMHNMAASILKNPINSFLSASFTTTRFPSEFNGLLLDITA